MCVRFATWNIACGSLGYNFRKKESIIDFFVSKNVDICFLQEVDRFAERSCFLDVPEYFRGYTGMNVCFYPSFTMEKEDGVHVREYGNGVLSRYEIVESWRVDLGPVGSVPGAHIWESERRSALFAKVRIDGKDVTCVSTHLAYTENRTASKIRREQVDVLVAALGDCVRGGGRVFVGGDFNVTLCHDDLAVMRGIFGDKVAGREALSGVVGTGVDYLFQLGGAWRGWAVCPAEGLSDHPMIVADL